MSKAANRIKQAKRDKLKFNVLVAGETGLGKSTFLNSLLRKYVEGFSLHASDELPEKTTTISNVGRFEILTDAGDGLDIVLYDSPGYGDFINNSSAIGTVKDYIYKAHQEWKKLDAQSMTEAEFLQADNRIHCVFYFIAPHRLKAIDLEFIKALSPLVPVIPIIAKSDIMTIKERNAYLVSIREKLDTLNTEEQSCVYDFEGDDLTDTSLTTSSSPRDEVPAPVGGASLLRVPNLFAVVCDSSSERAYPWGTLMIDDPNVSDFRRLQNILFENELHLKGMMDDTRKKSIRLARS